MWRNDDFLKNVPVEDQKYFLQKTPASDKVLKLGDKIAQKFPVSILCKDLYFYYFDPTNFIFKDVHCS
jgi:hypothetical protein